jgi:methionyl-tRNA formyltransferase
VTARTLRLAFFGTPEFAVPTLERLIAGRHPVVAVVSQPDRRRGRGRQLSPAPVSRLALREKITLLRPEALPDPALERSLREAAPDLGVVVAYGQFIPRRIRELPVLGYCINGHASLLPKLRGAAPIARAILTGETLTGVSVIRLEREMDAGPVAATRELEIGSDETAGSLGERLALLSADAIEAVVEQISEERAIWVAQNHAAATTAPKLERAEARLDWSEPADALVQRVRAMSPKPGAFTAFGNDTLRILAAHAESGAATAAPGTVRCKPGRPVRIATGDGWLIPRLIQRSGGKALDLDAFVRGTPIPDGAVLGADPAAARLDS